MKKYKKQIIIMGCILLSFLSSYSYDSFINNSSNLISVLLTVLALSFTSFSFIITSLAKYGNEVNGVLNNKKNKLLDSIKNDIMLIFYMTIALILLNLFENFDIPFIQNPVIVDFGEFSIEIFKHYVFKFLISFSFSISLFSMYDIIKALFSIITIKDNIEK